LKRKEKRKAKNRKRKRKKRKKKNSQKQKLKNTYLVDPASVICSSKRLSHARPTKRK
jgi:hypothetical protein